MDNKKKTQARRKQEDAALNKLLIWFGIAIGYEAIVLLLKRFYVNYRTTEAEITFAYGLSKVFSVLWWLTPVLAVAGLVWLVWSWKQKKPLRVPAICAAALCALAVTCFLCARYSHVGGLDLLGAVAPATAVLALIFYLYQKEFFCNTILTGGGILSLWLYRRLFQGHPNAIRLGFVLGWVLLAAAAWLAWKLSRSAGKWKRWQLFPAQASYVPTYVTCAVTALTMIAALIGGASVAFYAMFVLVIWLFCMAVYYTVGLM